MDMNMNMEMDLGVSVTRTGSPDSDTETPPPPRHNPPTSLRRVGVVPVSYKECMKNHAASIGGHALDGCCEFMPGPTFNPLNPTSLKCGACGCHRNFHRRDPDDPTPLNHHPTPARVPHSPPTASQLLLSLSHSPSGPSDDVNETAVNNTTVTPQGLNGHFTSGSSSNSRKRFRTKFTQEQKEKMHDFSEKIGWRLKKGDEKLIEDFVKEIGVGRSVFKVWMHNNKHNSNSSTIIKNPGLLNPGFNGNGNGNSTNSNSNNCGASVFDNHHNNNNNNHHRQFNFGNGGGQEVTQAQ